MNKVSILLFFMLGAFSLFAQDKNEDKEAMMERMEALKVSFITQKLDLTKEEAKAFWPVYNKYKEEMGTCKSFCHASEKVENLSDEEIENMLNERFVMEQKKLDIKKKYHEELTAILPAKKIALLYEAEYEFKKQMIEKLREDKDKS